MYKVYKTKHSTPGAAKLKWRSGHENLGDFQLPANQIACKNMPPSNMRYISCSLTNKIADILYVNDNFLILCSNGLF